MVNKIDTADLSRSLEQVQKKISTFNVDATFVDISDGVKAAESNPFANLVEDVEGAVVGGIKSLTKAADNLADKAEAALDPVIVKFDETISEKVDGLKTEIDSADLTSISDLFESTLVELEDIFETVQETVESKAQMLKEVISDGSLESIAENIQREAEKRVDEISEVLGDIAPPDFTGDVENLVTQVQENSFVDQLSEDLSNLGIELQKAFDGLTSGSLLKDLTESLTGNVRNAISSLGLPDVNEIASATTILSNNIQEAKDQLISKIPVSSDLSSLLPGGLSSEESITALAQKKFDTEAKLSTSSLSSLEAAIKNNPEIGTEIDSIVAKSDQISEEIKPGLGSIGGTVTTSSAETPQYDVPTVKNASNLFGVRLYSVKELNSYFQGATREITTLRFGWWPVTFANDPSLAVVVTTGQSRPEFIDAGWDIGAKGPQHLWISSSGIIYTSRSLDALPGGPPEGDANFKDYSVLVILNTGANRSITSKQYEAVRKIEEAFNQTIGGDVFGNCDLYKEEDITSAQSYWVGPGFSPAKDTNLSDPLVDKRFLSLEERKERSIGSSKNKENEQLDVQ